MNIRWRLSLALIQAIVIMLVCYWVTGHIYTTDTWFLAGLLAVIINPQLLEPHYSRPTDVIGNSAVFLLLTLNTPMTVTKVGWVFFGCGLALASFLAAIALILGAGRRGSKYSGIANSARSLSQIASSRVIYSIVFLLAAIESFPVQKATFWILTTSWVIVILLGKINWQALWSSARGREAICIIEGMIGPSTLLVSAPDLPDAGRPVSIKSATAQAIGVVVHRIRRISDTWGQIHVSDRDACESMLAGQSVSVSASKENVVTPVGSADQGSSDKSLRFTALRPLEIGHVVGVPQGGNRPPIIYQLSSAHIDRTDVKGGSHLLVKANANQLGVFNPEASRLHAYRWVPPPGAPVLTSDTLKKSADAQAPADSIKIGSVIGTDIPIFLDCKTASEGHLAILGMTKMGKSTFASRLANELAKTRRVTILDQTGEYVSKKGLKPLDNNVDWTTAGISVFEPKPGEVAADRALAFLNMLINKAVEEYKTGTPFSRVVIIDEAHQFIPEPAGLGFNAPGRDSSFKIGLLLMQIRKYGISVILISQRTAVVAKSALSQCENLICFRSVDQTGLDYLEAIAGGDIRSILPQLRQGEALVFGPAITSDAPVALQVDR